MLKYLYKAQFVDEDILLEEEYKQLTENAQVKAEEITEILFKKKD